MRYCFSSESVTEGHPDKFCDGISDAILDAILEQDPYARVALETVAKGSVRILGEVTTTANYDPAVIARNVVRGIGYTTESFGIDPNDLRVDAEIVGQSRDISQGVDGADVGAGDQGIMFGYACNETRALMPAPIFLAHRLAEHLAEVRKDGTLPYLRPDGKTQVTIDYKDPRNPKVAAVVIAAQHDPDVENGQLRQDIENHVIAPVLRFHCFDPRNAQLFINNTGRFVQGGPMADAGLTGRKIVADTYGGASGHGGGAFSGKDPTKVDRTASYMLRHIAKNIVAAGVADRCEIQVGYAIGGRKPVSLHINTYGTEKVPMDDIYSVVENLFPLSPGGMIDYLELRRPIFAETTNYGHFGREGLPWESTHRVNEIRANVGL